MPELADVDLARAVLLEHYIRVQLAEPSAKKHVLLQIYGELKERGQPAIAELLLTFHAIAASIGMDQTTYNFDSPVANVNFGKQLGPITAAIGNISQSGPEGRSLASSLKQLAEGVVNSEDLTNEQKTHALEAIGFAGTQAERPSHDRQMGILKPALESIPKIFSSTVALAKLWETFGPHIMTFFGLS